MSKILKSLLKLGDPSEYESEFKKHFREAASSLGYPEECISNFLGWLEETDFFSTAASTRFHHSYEGGLLEHSLEVMCKAQQLATSTAYAGLSKAEITIAALCHDLCKIGIYKPGTRNVKDELTGTWNKVACYSPAQAALPFGHGELSVLMLYQHFAQVSDDIILGIRYHMGTFWVPDELKGQYREACTKSPMPLLLFVADMMSSEEVEV